MKKVDDFMIEKVNVKIEASGDRFLDFQTKTGSIFSFILPYELAEQFVKDLQVTTDHIDRRNQKAWEAISKIRALKSFDLGSVFDCLKDMPQVKISPKIEEPQIKSEKVKLNRDISHSKAEELGLIKGATFEVHSRTSTVVCIKVKDYYITLQPFQFEILKES